MTFLSSLPPPGPARDDRILGAIACGALEVTWTEVSMGRVLLTVSVDYVKIDGSRIPMSAPVAQAAVDALDALLPTPAIVDAIEAHARAVGRLVPFMAWPHWQDDSQLATSTILWREQNIPPCPPGTLLAGCLKDVVLAREMPAGKVVIYGGIDADGKRVQPLYAGHGDYFDGGYAHGVRAIRDACTLDGAPARVSELLAGPEAHLLGGPVARLRYPSPLRG